MEARCSESWMLTRRGRVLYLYDQMEPLFNWSFRETVGQPLHGFKQKRAWNFYTVYDPHKFLGNLIARKGIRELQVCHMSNDSVFSDVVWVRSLTIRISRSEAARWSSFGVFSALIAPFSSRPRTEQLSKMWSAIGSVSRSAHST